MKTIQQTWFDICKDSLKEAELDKEHGSYNQFIGESILKLCKTFVKQMKQHSEESAEQTARLFLALVLNNGRFDLLNT